MKREPSDLKKRSGAELRALAAERAAAAADPAEQARRVLANHEHVIETARRWFVDMGRSLLAIRTERLYAIEYSTFAEYCEARWDVSETYANRVISASLVAIKATPIGVEINSEAVARELADLADKPEQLRQVWDEATRRAAGGRITAALIKAVRKDLDPPKPSALEGEIVNKDSTGGVPVDGAPTVSGVPAGLGGDSSPATESGPKADPGQSAPTDSGATGSAAGVGAPADRPAPAATQDRPVDAPGEAEDGRPSGGDSSAADGVATPAATQTGPEVPTPVDPSGLVDGRQQQDAAGESRPAAADPDLDDEAQRLLDWRRGVSRDVMQALVDAHMRLQPDPLAWLETVYLPGSYPDRDMPRVRECFKPEAIRITGRYLLMVADYLERNEIEL